MSGTGDGDMSERVCERGLGPPRFRLSTLFGVMTGISLVLATYTGFGGFAASMVGLLILAIFAHVAGNWLGTQLRELGDQSRGAGQGRLSPHRHERVVQSHEFAAATQLGDQQPISWWVKLTVMVGAIGGGLMGGALLIFWNAEKLNFLGLLFGSIAFAVLGAIWSFALGAFIHVGWNAWRQAARVDERLP